MHTARTELIRWLVFSVTLGASLGCSKDQSEAVAPDDGTNNGSQTPVDTNDAGTSRCEMSNLKGSPMVEVPTTAEGSYCIDATEVTRGQYKKFLDEALLDVSLQGPECKGLLSNNQPNFPPSQEYDPNSAQETFEYSPPDAPMVWVSVCTARAYCSWAGKRLCGKIGGGGIKGDDSNPNIAYSEEEIANAAVSQWYNACSQRGTSEYATGTYPEPDCAALANSSPPDSDSRTVGSVQGCRGNVPPFDRVFDLAGGVDELEDFCGRGGCVIRGGGNAVGEKKNRCDGYITSGQTIGFATVGFRCCAD